MLGGVPFRTDTERQQTTPAWLVVLFPTSEMLVEPLRLVQNRWHVPARKVRVATVREGMRLSEHVLPAAGSRKPRLSSSVQCLTLTRWLTTCGVGTHIFRTRRTAHFETSPVNADASLNMCSLWCAPIPDSVRTAAQRGTGQNPAEKPNMQSQMRLSKALCVHIGYAADVPLRDISVKSAGAPEHKAPGTGRPVSVDCSGRSKVHNIDYRDARPKRPCAGIGRTHMLVTFATFHSETLPVKCESRNMPCLQTKRAGDDCCFDRPTRINTRSQDYY